MRTKSEQFFHAKPENFNCAQAVLKGFQNELNISQEKIDSFRAFGGGRAPEGLCGALFAAETLLAESGKPSVREEFAAEAGDITCRGIKTGTKTSCLQCAQIADKLLEKILLEK
jgi:hypothetical protein